MTNDPYRGGGAEYGGPQYAPQQPTMRPVGSQPAAYPAHVEEPWGKGSAVAPSAPASPPTPPEEPNTVVLSHGYQAHGEYVHKITLRPPVTKEIRQCGNPLKVTTGPDGRVADVEVKYDVVAKYIHLLATPALPPSTVDQFEFFDLDACAGVICGFFVRIT